VVGGKNREGAVGCLLWVTVTVRAQCTVRWTVSVSRKVAANLDTAGLCVLLAARRTNGVTSTSSTKAPVSTSQRLNMRIRLASPSSCSCSLPPRPPPSSHRLPLSQQKGSRDRAKARSDLTSLPDNAPPTSL
jgi:hypothetical protein